MLWDTQHCLTSRLFLVMRCSQLKSRSSNVYCWCPVTAAVNPFCFGGCKSVISKTATLTGTQNRGTPSEPCLLVSSFMGGGVGEGWRSGEVEVGGEQYLWKGERNLWSWDFFYSFGEHSRTENDWEKLGGFNRPRYTIDLTAMISLWWQIVFLIGGISFKMPWILYTSHCNTI